MTAPLAPAPPDLPDDLTPARRLPPLRGLGLREVVLQRSPLSAADATGVELIECRLEEVELAGATVRRASLRDVVVIGGNWSNVQADELAVTRAEFRNARLTGAAFGNARFEDVTFAECRLDLASFRFSRFERAAFDNCRMEEADFYEASMKSVTFIDCTLSGATLAGATFSRSELRGCDLAGVGNPEQLRGVRMPWPDVVQSAATLAEAAGIDVID